MRLVRVTGFGGEGLLDGEDLISAVEDARDWMERGGARRAEGGMVAMHVVGCGGRGSRRRDSEESRGRGLGGGPV